jgi:hypothetical protein
MRRVLSWQLSVIKKSAAALLATCLALSSKGCTRILNWLDILRIDQHNFLFIPGVVHLLPVRK